MTAAVAVLLERRPYRDAQETPMEDLVPLTRPTPDADRPAPFTIDRANLTGMAPGEAHQAVLGALDAGASRARGVRGMVKDAIIDAALTDLANTRQIIEAHAPYGVPGEEGTFCEKGVSCETPGPWACSTYRAAAATIADGLG